MNSLPVVYLVPGPPDTRRLFVASSTFDQAQATGPGRVISFYSKFACRGLKLARERPESADDEYLFFFLELKINK